MTIEWVSSTVGLIELEGILAGAGYLAYFTMHEQMIKAVKRIEKQRREEAQAKLAKLIADTTTVGDVKVVKISKDTEDKFQDLFDKEYSEVSTPSDTLRIMDMSFLFGGILCTVAALLDWAQTISSLQLLSSGLSSLEAELFIVGCILLAMGIYSLQRLRRLSDALPDLDPAPLNAIMLFGLIFAVDVYLLYLTGSLYNQLTFYGQALFASCLVPIPGIILVIFTWEGEDWRRALGQVMLFAPYIVIFAYALIMALNSVFHFG